MTKEMLDAAVELALLCVRRCLVASDDVNERAVDMARLRRAAAATNMRLEAQDRERDRITMAAHCRMAALEAIQAERARQLSEEGWSVEHDDRHSHGEIARAAAAYAAGDSSLWPWEPRGVKLSSDRLRDLAKAGALIVAEMERLMREEMDRGE